MIRRWAIYALLVAVAGLSGALMLSERKRASLAAENERLSVSLATCEARQSDILEQRSREDEIRDLSIDDLRRRAAEWMRQ